jgi:hypothetical protein
MLRRNLTQEKAMTRKFAIWWASSGLTGCLVVDRDDVGTVHGVAFWGDTTELLLTTDAGIFRTDGEGFQALSGESDLAALHQDPFDLETYWASNPTTGEVVVSDDGGQNWVSRYDEAFDVLALGTRVEGLVAGFHADTLYVSEDAGRTWHTMSDERMGDVRALGVDDRDGSDLAVLLGRPDDGILWYSYPGQNSMYAASGEVSGLDPAGGPWLAAATDGTLTYCDSAFTQFDPLSAVLPSPAVRTLQSPDDIQALWALLDDASIVRSTDFGSTWMPLLP